MRNGSINHSRRSFLRGGVRPDQMAVHQAAPRLPWADRDRFFTDCTRCGDCSRHCAEGIIAIGDGGFPQVDFHKGECTFCGRCRDACPENLLSRDLSSPWDFKAIVSDGCLSANGISCQSCRDVCDSRAIRFRPQLGGISRPEIAADLCNGCGACVAPCPVSAIDMAEQTPPAHEIQTSNETKREAAHA